MSIVNGKFNLPRHGLFFPFSFLVEKLTLKILLYCRDVTIFLFLTVGWNAESSVSGWRGCLNKHRRSTAGQGERSHCLSRSSYLNQVLWGWRCVWLKHNHKLLHPFSVICARSNLKILPQGQVKTRGLTLDDICTALPRNGEGQGLCHVVVTSPGEWSDSSQASFL